MTHFKSHRLVIGACCAILAASESLAHAGPLPVRVLEAMYARTQPLVEASQDRIIELNEAIQALDDAFAARMARGEFKTNDAYLDALGEYFDQSAVLQSDLAAEQARLSGLSEHMHFIKIQFEAWGVKPGVATALLAPTAGTTMNLGKRVVKILPIAKDVYQRPAGIGDDNGIHPQDSPGNGDEAMDVTPPYGPVKGTARPADKHAAVD